MAYVKFLTLRKLNKFQAPGSPQEALYLCLFSSSHGGIKEKKQESQIFRWSVLLVFNFSPCQIYLVLILELGSFRPCTGVPGCNQEKVQSAQVVGLQSLRSYKFKKNFPTDPAPNHWPAHQWVEILILLASFLWSSFRLTLTKGHCSSQSCHLYVLLSLWGLRYLSCGFPSRPSFVNNPLTEQSSDYLHLSGPFVPCRDHGWYSP